jgi:hypothetical protein
MNLLLAGLLVAAMVVGIRLNRRLKALKDSHAGFEIAVRELNMAAVRAEQGLSDLRAATDEATDMLSDRIEKGRALAAKLEKLVSAAPELPRAMLSERAPRPLQSVVPAAREGTTEDRLGKLLAMARSRLQAEGVIPDEQPIRASEPLVGRAPLPGRRATPSIDDYADRHAERVQWYEDMNGRQEGDPAKLAQALLTITSLDQPPRRFIALAAILDVAEQKAQTLQAQADAYRELSSSLTHDNA